MEKQKNKIIPEYFAAANSYEGFISFFDNIFNSEKFDRIYVIKGGPGTGKTVMAIFLNLNVLILIGG